MSAEARALAARERIATLATIARDPAGTPFASLVAYALVEHTPILLVSVLAEHTKNLSADPRCSLLVVDRGAPDPLAAGRVTLLGRARRDDDARLREAFLAAHPEAASYAGLRDFAIHAIDVESARWVGGFGRMSWIDRDAWRAG